MLGQISFTGANVHTIINAYVNKYIFILVWKKIATRLLT
jgi:hypothetical protein